MTPDKHLERVMALSGIYQAATLVQQVAREGNTDNAPLETSIESLFRVESATTEAVFGGWDKLQRGLVTLVRVLTEIMCSTSRARHGALWWTIEDVSRSSTPLGSRGDVARELSSGLRVS